jgi:hypothetical protein
VTPAEALSAVHNGQTVYCTPEEYSAIRDALQDQAGRYIDAGDGVRAGIALQEVQRLDQIHGITLL